MVGLVASVDLVLHPIRLRIMQAFLGGRELTTGVLAGELADVPAGSLYRHVSLLVDAGVLEVIAERRVRGAVERTYALRLGAAKIEPDELVSMSAEEHRQAFMVFVAGLLGEFDRYLGRGDIDLVRDRVSYNLSALWLDDTELTEMLAEITEVFRPRLANQAREGRTRRLIGSILIPSDPSSPHTEP
jgi:DNA-binding transcriptional ArsR family regulator